MAALGLFEGIGLVMSPEEKEALVLMEEDDMIDHAVRKMSAELQRNLEHFALQLQLIVSTATRVRGALEQEDVDEVVSIMEHGDAGITQHIMKRTVVEAAKEIVELKDVNDGWSRDMGSRLNRLSTLAEEQERNRIELDKVNAEIAAFHGKQNEKAVKAVTGLAEQSNATLVKAAFGGWMNHYIRYKGEKHIHEKFQAEIVQAKQRLKEMEGKSVSAVKRSLMGNADKANDMLLQECIRRWAEDVKREKADRMAKLRQETEMAHLECLRADQKAAAKRKQKDFEEREARLQQQLGEMKSKSGGSAKGVLSRGSESSTSGITGNVFVHWRDHSRSENRARNLENTIQASEAKFKSLNQKQKGNTEQLQQAQSMFKDFTAALEQGMANTPRTEKPDKRGSSGVKASPKPPALPSAE